MNILVNWFQNLLGNLIQNLIYYIPLLIISITVHEYAHAKTAQRLGDDTAYLAGRVSLNPLRHLDPVGSLCMVLFGFGWGKAVPIAVLNFKNPKRDSALVALAGPATNLIMACGWGLLFGLFGPFLMTGGVVGGYFATLMYIGIYLNCILCVFNLLPITPLDGSRVLSLLLPDKWYYKMIKYERVFFAVLVVLMFLGVLSPVISWLGDGMMKAVNLTFVNLGAWITQGIASLF